MIGRIRRRSKHSWEICIDIGRDAQGKRQRKFENVKGKKADADRRLRELIALRDGGIPLTTEKATVAEFFEVWFTARERNIRPRTLHGYRGYVRRYVLPSLGAMRLSQLQPAHLDTLYSEMERKGLSGTTVLQMHRILSEGLKHAMRWGLVTRNVAQAVTTPKKARPEIRYLLASQLNHLLSSLKNEWFGPAVHLAAYTGMRRGELVGLRWSDIDLDRGTISVRRSMVRIGGQGFVETEPKTAKGRRLISITDAAILMLKKLRANEAERRLTAGPAWQENDLVFTSALGAPVDPDTLSHAFSDAIKDLGLPKVRLHDLRHSHATLMLSAGVHPKIVQERLGHANIAITLDTYSHIIPGLQETAAKTFDGLMAAARRAPVS